MSAHAATELGPTKVESHGWIYTYTRAPFPDFHAADNFEWHRMHCDWSVARMKIREDLKPTAVQECLEQRGWSESGKVFKK